MIERPDDSGEARRDAPLVFVCDASAEAERLTQALRARGYQVADVPLSLLLGRTTVQRPALVVFDAEADQAVETLEKLRADAGAQPIPTILLGERGGPLERVGSSLVAAAFARPVNVQELVVTVARLVGVLEPDAVPPSLTASTRGKVVASSRPPGRQAPPSLAPARDRPIRAETAPSPATLPLPPDLAGDAVAKESGDAPVVELSPEVHELLAAAERRFSDNKPAAPSGHEGPTPDGEDEGPLTPDILAALDEPLDEEDAGDEGSSADDGDDRTNARRLGTTSHTRAGRTGMTTFGREGTQATGTGDSSPPPRPGGTSIGPALEMPPATEPPPAGAGAEDDEGRARRQQASTPKPPRPVPTESQAPGAAINSAAASEDAGRRAPTRPPRAVSVSPKDLTGHTGLVAAPEPEAGARELTSTTPPLNKRLGADERTPAPRRSELPRSVDPAPAPEPPRSRQERPSDLPPFTHRDRLSELPAPSLEVSRREVSIIDASPPAPRLDTHPGGQRVQVIDVPPVLRPGDTIRLIASAIRARFTGALALEVDEGIRRIVLRDGDFVTVASGVHGESLVSFLSGRGDLPAEVARQSHKLAAFGRRAGAALIAQGHLAQDQLWTILRAHAEWLIGKACRITRGAGGLEDQLIERLQDEPAVFGGATGAEVLVDIVRRVVPPDEAMERLGGRDAVLGPGAAPTLLGECALPQSDTERIQSAAGRTVAELVDEAADPSLASVLYALLSLGVVSTTGTRAPVGAPSKARDRLDDDALRARILARKALVDEGDYFAVLGIPRDATGYDIRRAYASLRKEFEAGNVLTPATVDLGDTVTEIVHVLEEAYEILGDQHRRDRYRRAIEAVP